ncbi:MAG: universal stress protein [Geminicoccaceae bacterium]|nr:universal stress protein [Geminicoccaceae bacterium]
MFANILVPVDTGNEESWRKALPDAVKLARAHGAKLHVMTVVPDFGSSIVASYFPEGFQTNALEQAKKELATLVERHVPADVDHDQIATHGGIWQEICRVAKEVGADLVVMASHKPAFHDVLLTPTAHQVLHHLPVSVMVVR